MKPEVRTFTRENPCTKAEVWREVPGYGGKYLVSNLGNGSRSVLSNLRYGTQSQNMLDRKEHGSETRPTAKLTVEQVIRIRRLLAQGRKPRQLAARFGVTPENVCHIRDRKTWRDV